MRRRATPKYKYAHACAAKHEPFLIFKTNLFYRHFKYIFYLLQILSCTYSGDILLTRFH